LAQFAGRRLHEARPYLIVDARYERVREAGVIRSQAVLLAIGIGWDGRRSILAVELANREAARAGATSCCASRITAALELAAAEAEQLW
jgi:putative transposase